ncbi:unnamed protein product [Ilex paraguariensis]|uniref:Uncharacterized protein n=1 Tax=Ilex paraguariensis TaxID=185542 RepID=A0ABC8QXY8_9AQUA
MWPALVLRVAAPILEVMVHVTEVEMEACGDKKRVGEENAPSFGMRLRRSSSLSAPSTNLEDENSSILN